jgi:predicted oxidoreductase (fatty acid repression mutant protein)
MALIVTSPHFEELSMSAIELFKKRRTQYALGKNIALSKAELETLVQDTVRETPSAFNSQSSRVVILFGDESQKLWDTVKDTLRPLVTADQFPATAAKIDSFAAGAGTILFFEDQDVIKGLQEQFALYASKFPEFSANSAGMAQFAVWTALANANIGASLQHYNPLIDNAVREMWNLPVSWALSAQMPFGSNEQGASAKQYIDDEARFRTFG